MVSAVLAEFEEADFAQAVNTSHGAIAANKMRISLLRIGRIEICLPPASIKTE
jgi:hypothetical protein